MDYLKYNKKNNGQILVELLVAVALAAIIFAVGGQLLDVTLQSNKLSKERLIANHLLQEGLEATIAVSSEKWHNIYNLNKGEPNYYHPEINAGKWVLVSGQENIILNDLTYTRSIIIENVNRDNNRNINALGIDDPSTQKVTVTVSWGNNSLTISKYFTRWPNETATQTDWSGGPGQPGPVTSFNNKYDTEDYNLDVTSTPGSIKLKHL